MENVGLWNDFPLKLSSKHYLPLWNNDDPEGEQWLPQRATPDLPLDVSRIILLCDLEASLGNTWGCLPLLVRVIHKSRLRYYGKCDITDVKKKVDYPYMAYFEVADQSGTMSLVLWNELCLDWYHSLHNYSVRDSYPSRSRPQMDHHRLRIFGSKEISLNRRNAVSVLTVVPQKNLPVQRGLPDVAYKFTCRSELKSLADNTACDVIGLVTFVGRVQRIRCPYDKGPEKFWTYRWVHALDGSSHRPFILEIFSSSQPDIFHSICPMTYLVCTQMRVCRGQGSSTPFLTSSCETEIYITGCHRGQPYVCDPRVKDFIQWTKTLKDGAILEKTAMGGHYCYPPAPPVFTQPMESGSVQVALVAAGDLQREVQSLQYREHKRLAIQGFIAAVRYVERPHDTEPSTGEAQVAGAASSGTSEALAERTASDHRDNGTSGGQTAPAGGATSPRSYMTRAKMRKRLARVSTTPVRPQDSSSESESESESETSAMGSTSQEGLVESNHDPAELSQLLRWESSDWSRQRQELSTHLFGDRLHQDSLTRKFSFEDRSALLRWSGLPPSHWTPDQPSETLPPVACSGYYHITILGINQQVAVDAAFCPVMSSEDPRAKGLPLDPHGNSLLSCLSTGFLCPLGDPAPPDLHINLPSPEEIFQTVGELEGTHLVCLLDLCHLGGDRVEILLNKVYQVT
ncbi:RPA-related protein RADX [Merluccius polli]|uniref:RPA-related protein RADX n=1 Tax=Merluccius polli TaxID=89951 RepID=A0AA47N6Y6_MERPO|nr:RPA-related protein RADX [Merluccius polli]